MESEQREEWKMLARIHSWQLNWRSRGMAMWLVASPVTKSSSPGKGQPCMCLEVLCLEGILAIWKLVSGTVVYNIIE